LRGDGVAVIFATGYGDGIDLPERFADVSVVKKPYRADDIAGAIES
jgi:hypothetical protein